MSTLEARPKMRRTVEIVAEAGKTGILGSDIAEHFTTVKGRKDVQSWVNILLSRALYDGRVRRTKHRELPAPGENRRHASYRWWITAKGLEYVNPVPVPDIVPFNEPPGSRRILEVLDAAGEQGCTGPVIARHFVLNDDNPNHSYLHLDPTSNLQRRLNWTNQILHRFLLRGYVEQGGKEISPFYHNVPAYRWYITDKGREYLHGGMSAGRRARREAAYREKVDRNAARRKHADSLITQAYVQYEPYRTPNCERNEAIRRLRAEGCTLEAIGGVFDLTRERVRQILVGISVGPCRCTKHRRGYSGTGWPT